MADKFGASHRELVKDTNAGNVAPPDSELKTSVSSSGRRITRIDNTQKSELTQGLLALGQQALGGIKKRQEERDFAEGYTRGAEEGYIESQQSPLRDMLFGPSATLRGAQKRFVENDSAQFLNAEMVDLENTMKQFDSKGYQEYLTDRVKASVQDHSDPEFKAQIMASATKHMESLGRIHAKARQDWVDQENEQATSDQRALAVLSMRTAQQHGDTKSQHEAQNAAREAFTKPIDMAEDVFHASVAKGIVKDLTTGEDISYKLAEMQGILEKLSPTDQLKVEQAKGIAQRKNDANFQRDYQGFLARVQAGTAGPDDAENLHNKYPDAGLDTNVLLGVQQKAQQERAEINREQAEADDAFLSGDNTFNDYTPAQKAIAVSRVFDGMANDAILKQQQDAARNGELDGDPNAMPTAEQRRDYMLDNPYFFASRAAMHPETKYPQVVNMATSMMHDIRNENLTPEGVELLKKKMNFMEQFKQQMGNNFHKQFRSSDDAANYAVYSGLVNEAGFNPTDVIRDLRRVAQAPDVDTTKFADVIEDNIEDVVDAFVDSSPESQYLWGLWDAHPDNTQAFEGEIRKQLTKYTEVYKGDMEKATLAATAVMRQNGVVSNGQFIMNGSKINIKGGSIQDYLRGVNANDNLRSQITNLGVGFAVDADYTDMEVTVDPFNKDNLVLHSIHEKTGAPISVVLSTPKKGSDFSTYGINSFTGYNPHIVNKDERRKAMLRDSVLLKGHRTMGKAVSKVVE